LSETLKLFLESEYYSRKHLKYFKTYDQLFAPYKDKKITFCEIGIASGGSLKMWRKFFGEKARIIGIDLNPECKNLEQDGFEIFIGSQSDPNFWTNFFNKVGKVDIVLDDGGHTNLQQILTSVYCIPNINDEGLLVTEDTHTSYINNYGNPSKYSFISFSKKIIDDINYTFPGLGNFNYSLNKFVYAIEFFESFVVFKVDKKRCNENKPISNEKDPTSYTDYKYKNINKKINVLKKKFNFLKKNKIVNFFYKKIFFKLIYLYIVFINKTNIKIYKKYFK